MKYLITHLLLAAILFFLTPSYAEVVTYKEETNTGTPTYVSLYGVSSYWKVKATRSRTSFGWTGYRRCGITPTDGGRYPKTGHYNSIDGPNFIIIDSPEFGKKLSMGIPARMRKVSTLTVGSRRYDYEYDHFSKVPESEALAFVPLFISEPRAKWSLEGKTGSVSLVGFTDAWNYCVQFVGFDPLKAVEE